MKLPKYKRDAFTFISNLSDYTANEAYPDTYLRDGYLLSEHYTTNKTKRLAADVKRRRNLLISDNGNYSRMKALAKQFQAEGLALLQQAKKEKEETGTVQLTTVAATKQLIETIAFACSLTLQQTNYEEIIQIQLAIKPHYLIGLEDLTIPVLMLCHLMHPVFSPVASEIHPFQQQTSTLFKAQLEGHYGAKKTLDQVAKFMVLHAYDYDSAFQAGQASLATPKEGVAISYGGPMHSRRWIEQLAIGGQTINLPEKLPEAYLIAQTITLGAVNGHPTTIPFHILGVGTPILIALIGYQLRHSKAVSIDSTAPFKDAFIGKLYGESKAFLKMDMYKLVAYCLIHDQPFSSKSPFYQAFALKYEHNWKGLQAHLQITPSDSIKDIAQRLKEDLTLLEQYLPFFTTITGRLDKVFLQDLRIARAGYNFWIIQRICKKVRIYRNNPSRFKTWIEQVVDQYTTVASRKWATTVALTYELAEKYRAL